MLPSPLHRGNIKHCNTVSTFLLRRTTHLYSALILLELGCCHPLSTGATLKHCNTVSILPLRRPAHLYPTLFPTGAGCCQPFYPKGTVVRVPVPYPNTRLFCIYLSFGRKRVARQTDPSRDTIPFSCLTNGVQLSASPAASIVRTGDFSATAL